MNRCDSGRMCERNQKGETGFVQLGGRGEVKRHARDSNMYIEREVLDYDNIAWNGKRCGRTNVRSGKRIQERERGRGGSACG